MKTWTRRLTGALVVVVALTAGCGGGDGTSDTPPKDTKTGAAPKSAKIDDACAIVTQADAERILGEKFVKSDFVASSADVLLAECVWKNVVADHSAILQFRIYDGPQFFTKDAFAAEPGFESVSGVGDDAFSLTTDRDVTVDVLSGKSMIQLDARGSDGFDPAAVRTELIALGKHVVESLG